MPKQSKRFRVATEGATADGRVIEREWIAQMAANYDPAVYRATVNIEHYRSTLPDGPFRNYGFVDALDVRENADGRLELFATIRPTDDLVAITNAWQKVFTSIEVNPAFADTGEAYLVGLAVTDTPASLGTEMLAFTAANPAGSPLTARKHHPANHFTAAVETPLEFIDVADAVSVLDRIRQLFARRERSEDVRLSDLSQAITEVAEHGQAQSAQTARQFETVDASLRAALARLEALEQRFDTTPATPSRPLATGLADHLTDF